MDNMNAKTIEINQEILNTKDERRATGQKTEIVELIIFHLGDEEFVADIAQVKEVIRAGFITPVPDSPDFIKGITNVRGEIALVIGLKERFFLTSKEEVKSKHIVMTAQEKNLFGLMVDEVTEVIRIPKTDIKPAPSLVTKIDRIYISGVITRENRLLITLDLNKVLSEEELERLSEIRIRHRETLEDAVEKAGGKKLEEKAETAPSTKPSKPTKRSKRKKQEGPMNG